MKQNNLVIKLVLVFLIVTLIVLLFTDMFEMRSNMYTVIRKGISYKEPFADLTPQDVDTSYSLLKGVLDLKDQQKSGSLNSQRCYEGDFQTRIEKTTNYRQLTNNYKRGDPDSCTAPLQEFVNAFYKIEPLN